MAFVKWLPCATFGEICVKVHWVSRPKPKQRGSGERQVSLLDIECKKQLMICSRESSWSYTMVWVEQAGLPVGQARVCWPVYVSKFIFRCEGNTRNLIWLWQWNIMFSVIIILFIICTRLFIISLKSVIKNFVIKNSVIKHSSSTWLSSFFRFFFCDFCHCFHC